MNKKKGFPLIWLIPLLVVGILVTGVFAYKLYSEGSVRTKAAGTPVSKAIPQIPVISGKPSSGYGAIKGPSPTPSPGPKTIDLNALINGTDDDGKLDFDAIEASASQL